MESREEAEHVAAIKDIDINIEHTPAADSMADPNTHLKPKKATMSSLRSALGVPPPANTLSVPKAGSGSSNNSGSLLGVPPSTSSLTAPQGIGGASGALLGGKDAVATLPSEIAPKRKKVVLEPGCSALDWARYKGQLASQRRVAPLQRITPSELKRHKSRTDAWSAFQGKVYDITPYLRFHPGGVDELMRVAGRDGTRLFSKWESEGGHKVFTLSYQCSRIPGSILIQ